MMPSNASSPLLVKRMQTPSADRSLGTTKTPLDAPPRMRRAAKLAARGRRNEQRHLVAVSPREPRVKPARLHMAEPTAPNAIVGCGRKGSVRTIDLYNWLRRAFGKRSRDVSAVGELARMGKWRGETMLVHVAGDRELSAEDRKESEANCRARCQEHVRRGGQHGWQIEVPWGIPATGRQGTGPLNGTEQGRVHGVWYRCDLLSALALARHSRAILHCSAAVRCLVQKYHECTGAQWRAVMEPRDEALIRFVRGRVALACLLPRRDLLRLLSPHLLSKAIDLVLEFYQF